uniref:Amino acid transporter transmembrane domain-containing protein n=1 Tax=Kalanchoe fedtschenkoi TaxID=63787 RepID=A0A7N0ZVV7_KALFE
METQPLILPTATATAASPPKPPSSSSQFKTFANVLIAIVGSGVLGLPYTFRRTGWLAGILILFAVATVAYYCMVTLIAIRHELESRDQFARITSFGDLGFAICGPPGRLVVDLMIILTQAGFCVSYLVFIAQTLTHLFNASANKSLFIWALLPFQMGINSIPTLTHLAPLSILADVVGVGALGVAMAYNAGVFLSHRPAIHPFTGSSSLLYAVGVAAYAYEGVGMVLPLESETTQRAKFTKVLGLSMVFITFTYAAFGVLGYMAFGDDTKDIITVNLGTSVVSYLVQFGLCVNLFLTFPLMMNPVYEVVERRLADAGYSLWIRWAAVVGVTVVAVTVPNFADFLSLVGSSVCIALGFVLPALFHMIVFGRELRWWSVGIDVCVSVLGVGLGVWGTWTSLVGIFGSA